MCRVGHGCECGVHAGAERLAGSIGRTKGPGQSTQQGDHNADGVGVHDSVQSCLCPGCHGGRGLVGNERPANAAQQRQQDVCIVDAALYDANEDGQLRGGLPHGIQQAVDAVGLPACFAGNGQLVALGHRLAKGGG